MALQTERIDGAIFRAYDPDNPFTEGYGTTRDEAIADAKEGARIEAARERFQQDNEQQEAPKTHTKSVGNAPAAKQLSSLGRRYLPAVDELVKRHRLEAPEWVRAMLARRVAHSREVPITEGIETRSPIPALRKAKTHSVALLGYAQRPPAREGSVTGRCAKLRDALLNDLVAMEFACLDEGTAVEYGQLLDALESGHVDAPELGKWLTRIDGILERNDDWGRLGRPSGLARRVLWDGCIAWRAAGRGPEYYQVSEYGKERLTGPLPDFLRALIACCDGTHELVKRPPRRAPKGYLRPARLGDGLKPTETLMHQYLVQFWRKQR